MMNTHVKASRDLRNNFPEIAELVDNHNQVIITRNGNPAMVLLNMKDYAEYEEFVHMRYVLEELKKAEEEAADPNTKWLTHDEVFNALRSKYNV